MNKKAIELSINFLVGLILGIVLLSLGLVFTFNIIKGVPEIEKGLLPPGIELEAANCVQRNERVCIPIVKQQTETMRTVSYGVIINNIYGKKKNFVVDIEFRRAIMEDGSETSDIDLEEWVLPDAGNEIENNDHVIVEVPIRPPKGADAGSYVFNINVCFDANDNPSSKCPDGSLYSPTQQITVEVY